MTNEVAALQIATVIERAVDDELDRLDNMDDQELATIRSKRARQVEEMAKRREGWVAKGHGRYHEVTDPKQFFDLVKGSERVICHFKRRLTDRCAIVDRHIQALAPVHWESLFICVDVEKVPSLPERFRVMMLPTIMLVEGGNTFHSIIGFDEFGARDDFSTTAMERVLHRHGMINDRDMFSDDQTRDDDDDN
mgnify:FL=1